METTALPGLARQLSAAELPSPHNSSAEPWLRWLLNSVMTDQAMPGTSRAQWSFLAGKIIHQWRISSKPCWITSGNLDISSFARTVEQIWGEGQENALKCRAAVVEGV